MDSDFAMDWKSKYGLGVKGCAFEREVSQIAPVEEGAEREEGRRSLPRRPQRRADGHSCGSSALMLPRYLYLVLDDWSRGYSIRKVNLSGYSDCDDPVKEEAAWVCTRNQQISPPAVFRFQARRGLPGYITAAFDSHIMAMQPGGLVPVYDVHRLSCMFCPRPKPDHVNPIYIPVGSQLFVLAAGSFEVLDMRPPDVLDQRWSWCKLPRAEPPFRPENVTSYAVHPDGRTIFVSSSGTFTIDTVALTSETPPLVSDLEDEFEAESMWKLHGQWLLPFTGRGHFDPVLNAWVGLSREPGSIGRLCSCTVVPTNSDDLEGQVPTVKLCKEKLFIEDDPVERHVGATLVFLGGRSYYCLAQCFMKDVSVDETSERNDCKLEQKDVCWSRVLRFTTFSVRYDHKGDVAIGSKRQVRDYTLPEAVSESIVKHPVVFWM